MTDKGEKANTLIQAAKHGGAKCLAHGHEFDGDRDPCVVEKPGGKLEVWCQECADQYDATIFMTPGRTDGGATEIYRDEYLRITEHNGKEVAVQVGNPLEEATPTIVDAVDVLDALGDHLHSLDAGDEE